MHIFVLPYIPAKHWVALMNIQSKCPWFWYWNQIVLEDIHSRFQVCIFLKIFGPFFFPTYLHVLCLYFFENAYCLLAILHQLADLGFYCLLLFVSCRYLAYTRWFLQFFIIFENLLYLFWFFFPFFLLFVFPFFPFYFAFVFFGFCWFAFCFFHFFAFFALFFKF